MSYLRNCSLIDLKYYTFGLSQEAHDDKISELTYFEITLEALLKLSKLLFLNFEFDFQLYLIN